MVFKVTEIEFEFGEAIPGFEQEFFDHNRLIVLQTISQLWDGNDEDDLIEEIENATGLCIKSINFQPLN